MVLSQIILKLQQTRLYPKSVTFRMRVKVIDDRFKHRQCNRHGWHTIAMQKNGTS